MSIVTKSKIKLIIVEDHPLMRQGLIAYLDDYFKIIGEASNGKEAIDLLKENEPDVVIMDIQMPIMGGHEALSIIKKKYPKIKVIIYTMFFEGGFISEYIKNGASAFINKGCDPDVIVKAINHIISEGFYFDNVIKDNISSLALQNFSSNPDLFQSALTDREIEVLKLVCSGKTNIEIASLLDVSSRTIDFHRQSIYKKTKSDSIVNLVKYAIKNGFTPID